MATTLEQLEAELQGLREQVAGLREQVAEAACAKDYLEIWKLQSLYSHLYYIGRRSEIPGLFAQKTPGVTLEMEDSGVYEGLESVTRFWNTVLGGDKVTAGHLAIHMTVNPVIEIDPERYPVPILPSVVTEESLLVPQEVPYGVDMVQASDIWDANSDGKIDKKAPTGAGRTVCIIDSGFYADHEDLAGVNVVGGYSQVDANWAEDGYGHGTHVAGTIVAMNNDYGVVGVTPGTASLFIVKIFGNDGLWVSKAHASDLVEAAYLCQANGANIISMSLGGGNPTPKEERTFEEMYASGILVVAAAGNTGLEEYHYPASYPIVVSVAAIDINMNVADFSTFNDDVELAAPGVNVLSTLPGNQYGLLSGTSMATPHASAVAALINRPEILQKVYLGQNSPLYSMVPNGMIYQSTAGNYALEIDPGLASGGTAFGPAVTPDSIFHDGANYGIAVDRNCIVWLAIPWHPTAPDGVQGQAEVDVGVGEPEVRPELTPLGLEEVVVVTERPEVRRTRVRLRTDECLPL